MSSSESSSPAGSASAVSSSSNSFSHRFTIILLHFNLAVYAFFWWFNQPVFPYLAKQLGADPVTVGALQSFNQFLMFCGTLFIGRLMDSYGARATLLASHVFAALSYLLLFASSSVPLLFLSQLPTAFLSAMHSSQTMITLITTKEERSQSLGRLSLSYGVGFLIGPACGGLATNYLQYADLALISAIGSVIVAIEIFIFIPDIRADHSSLSSSSSSSSISSSSSSSTSSSSSSSCSFFTSTLSPFLSLLSSSTIRSVVCVKLLCVFSISLFRSSFILLSQEVYALSAQDQGVLLSFVGLVTILVNSFFIQPLTNRFSDRQIVFTALSITTASFLSFMWLPMRYPLVLLWVFPLSASNSIVATLLTGSLTKLSALNSAGLVLGLDMAVGSAARIVSPLLGGFMVKSGLDVVSGLSALIAAGGVLFLESAFPDIDTRKQVGGIPKEEKEKVK